jgi:hypothetical protein
MAVVKDEGRTTTHWWYSRADRSRIDRLSDEIDETRRRAETAPNEQSGSYHLRSARRLERIRRTHRTFPMSIWLWAASVIVVILPWSLLGRAGHAGIGLAVSAGVLAVVLYIR